MRARILETLRSERYGACWVDVAWLWPRRMILGWLSLQASVQAGEEDAARDALEALNVVGAKQPELLTEGEVLEVVVKAMLALSAGPGLEVREITVTSPLTPRARECVRRPQSCPGGL